MAVGTVVLTSHNNVGGVRSIVVTATASNTDASFPTATLFGLGLTDISGALLAIATNPGSPAPTDNYDITLVDGDGLDRLNGVGVDRDTTTSERAAVTGSPYFTQGELGSLTLTITGNAVNSAVVVITLYYSSSASAAGSSSGGGGAVTNAGTFAVQESQILADNAGFTDGTTKVYAAGFIFDEVAGTALTENDVAAPRIDSKRATVGVIEDATTRGRRATVSASGALSVDALSGSSSATLANQTDQATAATLIASNSARKGFAVYNDSTQPMYLKFGATASATDFTTKLDPGGYYEMFGVGVYTGAVSGIWAADASGSSRATEW